jgi:hypothetical protein
LRSGSFPIWDPFIFAGRSFPGEMQTGAFYPLNWLLALSPLNRHDLLSPQLYNYFYVFSHFLAGVFMFRLVRSLELGSLPAFVAAACFSFAGFVGNADWPHMLGSSIWLPLILLFLIRLFRDTHVSTALRDAALCGLCFGMSILAGGLNVCIMQGIFFIGATVWCLLHKNWSALPRRLQAYPHLWTVTAASVIFGIAGLIGAVQLFPSHEYAVHSIRFVGAAAFPSDQRIPYAYLQDRMFAQSLVSLLFRVTPVAAWYGEPWSAYIGVLPLFLAFVAIWRRWDQHWVRLLGYTAGLSFLFALGSSTPFHGVLYAVVPFLWMAREATRFLYLTQFALALLAAFGLQSVLDAYSERTRWKPVLVIAKYTVIAALAMFFALGLIPHHTKNSLLGLSMLFIICSCGLLVLLINRPPSRLLLVGTACFILLDLGSFVLSPQDKLELQHNGTDFYTKFLTCESAAKYLKSLPGFFRVEVDANPSPAIGDGFAIRTTTGGAVTFENSFNNLLSRPDLMNVRYALKPASTSDPGEIYRDANWKIYENKNAFPPAWIVHSAVVESSTKIPSLDLHHIAVLSAPLATRFASPPADDSTNVTMSHIAPTEVELHTNALAPGLLVVSELYYPGWQATVNDRAVAIQLADGGLRAVPIPAGNAKVVMRYAPDSIDIGATLSLFGVIIGLALITLDRVRRRTLKTTVTAKPLVFSDA